MIEELCGYFGHFYPIVDLFMFQAACWALNHTDLEARVRCRLCGHLVVKPLGL